MNREILFKAKRKDNGEWAKGCLIIDYVTGQYFIHQYGDSVNESQKNGEERCLRFVAFEIDSDTLCQYTGLTDKNGKKIWENDIISISAYSYDEPEDDHFGVVTYCEKDACWSLNNNEKCDEIICECFGSYITEIINHGNIFDNADLLEV